MEKAVIKFVSAVLLLLGVQFTCIGQQSTPPLERVISVEFGGESLKAALKKIEKKGGFAFAYKTGSFNESTIINRAYIKKTTREILDDIFQGEISYKSKGNYIILRNSVKKSGSEIVIDGYVIDIYSQEKIPYATVYDIKTLSSAVSDEYGHFELKLDANVESIIKAKKANYHDADVVYSPSGPTVMNISMSPLVTISEDSGDTIIVEKDSMDLLQRIQSMKWLKLSPERKANIDNFKELVKTKAQFSLIPNVGTNGKLSSSTTVDYSFNLIGGFVGGVRKLELAAGFNIDLDSVKYFQAAGLFNGVGGYQEGIQAAGIFNLNLSDFKGIQFAGTSNLVRGNFTGVQVSGFNNLVLGKTNGFQVASFTNFMSDSSYAGQFAGFFNYADRNCKGGQAAGFVNFANDNFRGSQFAGFGNVSTGKQEGVQVASFFNSAETIHGSQYALLNFSDSIAGIPVGLMSFSRKGLHQLELSTSESMYGQLAFKTGVNSFYNSILVSGRFDDKDPVFGIGYGLGTSNRLGGKSRLFYDLQSQWLTSRNHFRPNFLSKFTISYQIQLKKNFAIAFGPSLNILSISDSNLEKSIDMKRLAPYNFAEHNGPTGRHAQMWVGGHVAIRLF